MEDGNASPIVDSWCLATIGGAQARLLRASGSLVVRCDMTFNLHLDLNGATVGASGKVRDEGGGAYAFVDPSDRRCPNGRAATLSRDGSVLAFPDMIFIGQATWAPY